MWSIWMFTIPSLRARECTQAEKVGTCRGRCCRGPACWHLYCPGLGRSGTSSMAWAPCCCWWMDATCSTVRSAPRPPSPPNPSPALPAPIPPLPQDALNLLFLAVPLLNVALPFVYKSFPFIFTADCVLMAVRGGAVGGGCGRWFRVGLRTMAMPGGQPQTASSKPDTAWQLSCCPSPAALQGVYAWKGLIPGLPNYGSGEEQQS